MTQVVRNVGAAGLAAGCQAMGLSCPRPDIPPSAEISISATCKILAGHKGDCETCPLPPILNSAQTPLLLPYEGEQWFTVLPPTLQPDKIGSLRNLGF